MAGLPEFGHRAVVSHEEGPSRLAVILILGGRRDIALIDAFVVMGEDAGDVQAVRARHTVLAARAGDGGIFEHQLGSICEQGELILGARVERRVGADVILQVLHIAHSAEHGEHSREGAGKAEGPGCDALLRTALLQTLAQMASQVRERRSDESLVF